MKLDFLKHLSMAVLVIFAGLTVSCSDDKDEEQTTTYTVTVTATDGGTAVADKTAYTEGENAVVTATPNEGFRFTGWYENETSVSTDAVYTFVMPAKNVLLQAHFGQETVAPGEDEGNDEGEGGDEGNDEGEGNDDEGEAKVEAIDLGLSVKWASWNVGASAPEDFGGLYGWADPTGEKRTTELDDYPSATPPEDICGTEYDIAHIQWGDEWRLPSQAEFQELVENCTWEWTEVNGVTGRRATAKNGNSIFFPAAASRDGDNMSNQVGKRGCYWSGTLYPGNDARYAYYFYFYDSNQTSTRNNRRYMGYSVRPVKI